MDTTKCYACGERKDAGIVHLVRGSFYRKGKGRKAWRSNVNVCEDCFMDHAASGAFDRDQVVTYMAGCRELHPWSWRQQWHDEMRDFRTVTDSRTRQTFSVRADQDGTIRFVPVFHPTNPIVATLVAGLEADPDRLMRAVTAALAGYRIARAEDDPPVPDAAKLLAALTPYVRTSRGRWDVRGAVLKALND